MPVRNHHFHFLLSDFEQARLEELAANAEETQSGFVRKLIKREWDRWQAEQAKGETK